MKVTLLTIGLAASNMRGLQAFGDRAGRDRRTST
jgi:hypothetical protein